MKKKFFTQKLMCLYICAILIFSFGTIQYYGNPYTRYQIATLMKMSKSYQLKANDAIIKSQYYTCMLDAVNAEYYSTASVSYFHMADSLLREAELKRKTLK